MATSGFERLGAYYHLGSTTLARTPSAAHQAKVLTNGKLFHSRWDAVIDLEHRRVRRHWRRQADAAGWTATVSQMLKAGVRQLRTRWPRMSRTHRASIAACFAYLQFALSIVVGLGLVPFVLHRVGERLYGYWLASGEVLAYAAMADLGVLGVVPWLIAEADGRRDRVAMQRIMSTAACAAVFVAVAYGTVVLVLWHVAPAVLSLAPADRAAIAGPLTTIACVTAVVLPLRVAGSALVGLQDVKFYGAMSTAMWALDLVITVTLLMRGYGLYALALAAAVPSLLSAGVMIVRLRIVAPDLVRGWPRPSAPRSPGCSAKDSAPGSAPGAGVSRLPPTQS